MKKLWKKPSLEVLDVNMTMKGHDSGGGEDNTLDPDPNEPGFDS